MGETSTTSRTLRLLELLQARRFWTGDELARRLDVTGRTLRRDVERLRDLGYRVEARRGRDGGYGLSTGGELPPLVFTPEEAAAIAAALASAAANRTVGGDDLLLTALAKVEQVMPTALRHRVRAFRSAVAYGTPPDGPTADPEVLAKHRMGAYARDFSAASTVDARPATDWRIADVRVEVLAAALVWLTWPFKVLDSPELSALLRERAARFAAAAG